MTPRGVLVTSRAVWPLLLLCLWLAPRPSSALKLDLKKKYEEELIAWALKQSGLERDPSPAGKVIERVEIVRENIIADSDPWPNFFNWVHAKTRDHVVRQELLVRPGQVWDERQVEESARNLRLLFILAVVRTVPCRSKKPGQVVLLVVTKDLWSLRINMVFSQVGSVVQAFESFPTEHNFLGRNKRLGLHFRLSQFDFNEGTIRDGLVFGQLYIDPRMLGTRLRLVEWFDLRLAGEVPCGGALGGADTVWCPGRSTGDLEGFYAQLQLTRPLYSLDTRWGFSAWVEADMRQVRRYRYNSGSAAPRGERTGLSLRTDTFTGHHAEPVVPRVYDARIVRGQASYTRSFGRTSKKDLTGGGGFHAASYRHPDDFPFPDEVLRWHAANYLPRSEDATYLFVKGRARAARYVRLLDVQGFALSEDYSLGHDVTLELRLAANVDDAAQSYFAGAFSSQYTWYFARDLLQVWLAASSRLQPGQRELSLAEGGTGDYDGPWANTEISVGIRNVSPPLWIGRVHGRLSLQTRRNDLNQQRLLLGGGADYDTTEPHTTESSFRRYLPALRGYPADQFEGDGLAVLNLEYRTRPLNLWTLHLGLVLFYDGGGVFGGPDPLDTQRELAWRYHHSVGIGVRGYFPQFDKESLRIDFAVPLTSDRGAPSTWLSLSFKQVF